MSYVIVTNNQLVTLDIKEIKGGHILWCIDYVSHFIMGIIIKDKEAEIVVKALYNAWTLKLTIKLHS